MTKPFEQYVSLPSEQAASQIYSAFSTPAKNALLLANPSMINMSPLGQPVNELASYLQPHLNNGTKTINNFVSGIQSGINQWATTPYNPGNIISTPYWENQIGSSINLIGHPIKTVGAIPGHPDKHDVLAAHPHDVSAQTAFGNCTVRIK